MAEQQEDNNLSISHSQFSSPGDCWSLAASKYAYRSFSTCLRNIVLLAPVEGTE
jgi:hypothetical protein